MRVLALHASRQLVPFCGGGLILCLLQDDASNAEWWTVTKLPSLAFDHKLIVRSAFQRLGERDDVKSEGGSSAAAILAQIQCPCMSEGNRGAAGALAKALQEGAAHLEGPWTPPKE